MYMCFYVNSVLKQHGYDADASVFTVAGMKTLLSSSAQGIGQYLTNNSASLSVIRFDIDFKSWQKLSRKRDEALNKVCC